MPLPEDEAAWETFDVMFATTNGSVRRNKLSDFAQVNRAGKIAMRLGEGEEFVDVQMCGEADDVLLTTANGQCIRFPSPMCASSRAAIPWVCAASPSPGRPRHLACHFAAYRSQRRERLAYLKMRRAVAGDVSPDPAARQ